MRVRVVELAVAVVVMPAVVVMVMMVVVATAAVVAAVVRSCLLSSFCLAGFTWLALFGLHQVQAALMAQGEEGGSGTCFARLTPQLAQGKVRGGAAALASLALLGLLLLVMTGCWG
jgi:hypothetical protein